MAPERSIQSDRQPLRWLVSSRMRGTPRRSAPGLPPLALRVPGTQRSRPPLLLCPCTPRPSVQRCAPPCTAEFEPQHASAVERARARALLRRCQRGPDHHPCRRRWHRCGDTDRRFDAAAGWPDKRGGGAAPVTRHRLAHPPQPVLGYCLQRGGHPAGRVFPAQPGRGGWRDGVVISQRGGQRVAAGALQTTRRALKTTAPADTTQPLCKSAAFWVTRFGAAFWCGRL